MSSPYDRVPIKAREIFFRNEKLVGFREMLRSHKEACHDGKHNPNCPACAELLRRIHE